MTEVGEGICEHGEGRQSKKYRFPLVVRSIGDRGLARQAGRLSRPWEARQGEVYGIERRVEVDTEGMLSLPATEIGYWRRGRGKLPDMSVSVFDLAYDEMKRVAPLVVMMLEDNRHTDLLSQHIKYHHETRGGAFGWQCRSYVCLYFWGGMVIFEESALEDFRPEDDLLPNFTGGIGFGFIWREVNRDAVPHAFLDADVMIGKFISDRVYPGLPEPVPSGRSFGVSTEIDDQILW
jgi:hypothetical protein